MEKIVPVISTSVVGPLGIMHLPRLWLKISLHAVGALPEGYRYGNGGFDEMTCVNIGLEPEALVKYIESELPTYSACEAWVKQHATKLDPESIARHNLTLGTWHMREEIAAERRATFGIADPAFNHAIMLNDLDDWAAAHAQFVQHRLAKT